MSDFLKYFAVTTVILLSLWVLWGLTGNTQQAHAEAAFNTWARQCNPVDFHYGQTDDGAGERAFIVTCAERK